MSKHRADGPCDCDDCFLADLHAVLKRFAEQREARQIERRNAEAVRRSREQSAWRDTWAASA
jgi:hypothetical protein